MPKRLTISASPPTVSIIVSVYNGADKVDCFISGLERFTEEAKAICEVIFVDSNSPDNTAEVLPARLALAKERGIKALYVRTKDRETIQRSWNRGIDLAQGRFLAFLGLDETVRPDAMAVMAAYLDKHPSVDWVQGSAVVTEVNEHGSYVRDVMCYDRSFDMQEMHYLECCYISYVGALYRKSIHERFGYYDDTFRGAGDTEFKNRMLPHIHVVSLPETFGTFLNYPEERTTQSPMAELEDLRAWHLFRSEGGIRYALENRDAEVAISLFKRALHYKKSYMDKVCTDVDFASSVAGYLFSTHPAKFAEIEQLLSGVQALQVAHRRFDELSPHKSKDGLEKLYYIAGALERVWFSLDYAQKNHQFFKLPGNYWLTNDNRWHQYHLLWPSVPKTIIVDAPVSQEDLAGCHDLAEVLNACESDSDWVDIDQANSTGKLEQIDRLRRAECIDLLVPATSADTAEAQKLIENFGDISLNVLIFGANHNLTSAKAAHIFFSGGVRNPRPAYAAAKLIVFPYTENAAQNIAGVIRALSYLKPVVVSDNIFSALEKTFPGIDFTGIPIAKNMNELKNILETHLTSEKTRSALSKQAGKIIADLTAAGALHHSSTDSNLSRSESLVEWQVTKDNFDELFYLECHQDVANAVRSGRCQSGWTHYDSNGRHEKRIVKVLNST